MQLDNDEFCYEYKDKMDYQKIMLEQRGLKGGTCMLENSILYHKKLTDKTITHLQFRHFIINRKTDNKNIHHFSLVYLQNGKMYIESRANFIHKKIHFNKWSKGNDIVMSEKYQPYKICLG